MSVCSFALLNLPNRQRITRRYMCSYVSPISLFPPLELLSTAAVAEQYGHRAKLYDAIAEQWSTLQTIEHLKADMPHYIITLIGFECFEEDMQAIATIKAALPAVPILAFGHYPTLFAPEILQHSAIDFIIKGEPEEVLAEWLQQAIPPQNFIHPLFVSKKESYTHTPPVRIRNIQSLPNPAYHLMDARKYFEPFMPRPFAMVQSARGCPYKCNYCVKSYGSRLSLRSPEQVIEELLLLKELHGIKSFRFIDDTFTVNHFRVNEICQLMMEKKLNLKWTCLSRTDNIKPDMLQWMKRAGCERIYFGIESGSQRMLDLYEKEINVNEALVALKQTRAAGIHTLGFFLLGLPEETEDDFKKSVQFALDANLTFLALNEMTLYPGTALFDKYRHEVDFSLFPYINRFKDEQYEHRFKLWEQRFYSTFYKRPTYVAQMVAFNLQRPAALVQSLSESVKQGLGGFQFMPGIRNHG